MLDGWASLCRQCASRVWTRITVKRPDLGELWVSLRARRPWHPPVGALVHLQTPKSGQLLGKGPGGSAGGRSSRPLVTSPNEAAVTPWPELSRRGPAVPGRPVYWNRSGLTPGFSPRGQWEGQGRDRPSVNQGEIICDYLSIIWNYLFFQRLFGLFVDYLSKNVPFFRQDYLRLFEIVDYLHYFRLF